MPDLRRPEDKRFNAARQSLAEPVAWVELEGCSGLAERLSGGIVRWVGGLPQVSTESEAVRGALPHKNDKRAATRGPSCRRSAIGTRAKASSWALA